MNETERKCFIEYFIELGNIEEYLNLEGELLKEGDDDLNKIIDSLIHVNKILKKRTQIKETEQNLNIDRIISFLSLHFSELSKEQVQKIPLEIIEEIMGNLNLKIEDEDSLLNLIIFMYEEDDKYCELFEYVKYEHLREETLFKFIDIFNINHINNSIWKSICQRLISSTGEEERKGKRYKKNINEFKYEQGKEFDGILRYLSSESNGNIHDNGTINISSNSIYDNDDSYHKKNLVDYQNNIYYESKNEQNVLIYFDFKDKEIQLSNY